KAAASISSAIRGIPSKLATSFGWGLTARSGLAHWARSLQNISSTKTGVDIRWECSPMTTANPALSIDRLIEELQTLAQISEAEPPVVTRVVFGEADMRARAYVKKLCTDAGLTITEDAIGNTFARWQGSDRTLPPIGTGSHIDAIPN